MTGRLSPQYIGAQVLEAIAEYLSHEWDSGEKRYTYKDTYGYGLSYNDTKEIYEIPKAYWDSYGKESVYKDFTVIVTQNTDLLHWREWVDQQAARWVGRGANIHYFTFKNWNVSILSMNVVIYKFC